MQVVHDGAATFPQNSSVIFFLKHLLRHIPETILVMWDDVPIHMRREVKDSLTEGETKRMLLERLIGHMPESNPEEGIWHHLKRVEFECHPSRLVPSSPSAAERNEASTEETKYGSQLHPSDRPTCLSVSRSVRQGNGWKWVSIRGLMKTSLPQRHEVRQAVKVLTLERMPAKTQDSLHKRPDGAALGPSGRQD